MNKEIQVTVVRVYLHEADANLSDLLAFLHDESKVRGVTVFRGITGFGNAGEYHASRLLDVSLDLPIVIEFFDEPEKAQSIIEELDRRVKPGHIAWWQAAINS